MNTDDLHPDFKLETAQRYFDTVLEALRKQKVRSMEEDSHSCLYRGPNGTKCAFGHLIPDSEYSPEMEARNAHWVIDEYNMDHLIPYEALVSRLQWAHDKSMPTRSEQPMETWERKMMLVAEDYGLKYTPVESLETV